MPAFQRPDCQLKQDIERRAAGIAIKQLSIHQQRPSSAHMVRTGIELRTLCCVQV